MVQTSSGNKRYICKFSGSDSSNTLTTLCLRGFSFCDSSKFSFVFWRCWGARPHKPSEVAPANKLV
eukprot:1479745-Amphidinium_carterae.1